MAKKAIEKAELDAIVAQTDLLGLSIEELGNKFLVKNNGVLLTLNEEATFAGGTLKAMLQGYSFFQGLGEIQAVEDETQAVEDEGPISHAAE